MIDFFNTYHNVISSIGLLFSTLGIIIGVIFTIKSLHRNNQINKINNLLLLNAHHREIWRLIFEYPDIERIFEANVDLKRKKINNKERFMITFLVLHLHASYQAQKANSAVEFDNIEKDIRTFFNRPIANKVWRDIKKFQNKDFVDFVEKHI